MNYEYKNTKYEGGSSLVRGHTVIYSLTAKAIVNQGVVSFLSPTLRQSWENILRKHG